MAGVGLELGTTQRAGELQSNEGGGQQNNKNIPRALSDNLEGSKCD